MLFQLDTRPLPNLSITLENDILEQVHKYKYLGFVLDNRLQFNLMFANLYSKLNHLAFILAKVRPYLTTKAAALVFKNKLISYLDYTNVFAYSFIKKDQAKLQTIQNKCIRTIYRFRNAQM